MTRFGFTLSSEEIPPEKLVRLAQRAEEVGFDFAMMSDHYHPWTSTQGNASFVWSVLGAVAATTINDAIAAWTRQQDAFELEARLAEIGVPASVVQRPLDVVNDPQIKARGIAQVLPHRECGDVVHWGFCTRFSAKPQMVRSAPPLLGEHNDFVMRDLLGLSDREIADIAAAGGLD